ncbi:MAG TPA: hypothetical protein VH374_11440 [Polyangia bacterium]|jgi:hypothetical protein|nr:hypothetical protein [Polyangia bacterium]
MLGIVLSLIVSLPPAPPTLATATCAADRDNATDTDIEGDGATMDVAVSDGAEPVRYATPAVIDCRLPVVTPVLQALVGECAGVTISDASYRASRLPESEAPAGSLTPLRPDGSPKSRLTVCSGLPAPSGMTWSPPSSQPLALFALPDLPRQPAWKAVYSENSLLRSALLPRLERPPRA